MKAHCPSCCKSLTVLVLNEYQVSNLRAAIEAAHAPGPLSALNNGDWLGEIYNMLPAVEYRPNHDAETLCRDALGRARLELGMKPPQVGARGKEEA